MEKSQRESSDLKTLSLFQANDLFVNKILSRNSSVGSSSRSYHGRVTGAVPFQWEARPGKPKLGPHKEEKHQHQQLQELEGLDFEPDPPLIGPPPGTQSLNMARLSHSGPLCHSRVWLWKKLQKGHKGKKMNKKSNLKVNFDGLDQFYHQADLCKSDEESVKYGSCGSSNSYNSSSTSSTGSASLSGDAIANFRPSKIQRLARGFIRWAF